MEKGNPMMLNMPSAIVPGALLLVSACSLALLACCAPDAGNDPQAEKAAIKEVIHNSIGWATDKDTDLLYRSVAQDAGFFIFHPDSRSTISGFEAFRAMVEKVFMNDAFKATGFEIRDLKITLSTSGTTAWFSAILDDHGEWDGKPSSWTDTRWTGVLEKRDNRWVIVQMHFSFASDLMNAEK